MLPEGVEWLQLVFASQLPLSLHRLPHTLQQLQLNTRHPLCFLQGSFAAHVQLRQLTLSGKGWAGPLSPHWLPPALVELNPQWTSFDSPLVRHALPATLRKIVLSHHYEQAFTSDSFAFRQQLEELSLPSDMLTQLLTAELVPASLRRLQVPEGYRVEQLRLPPSVLIRTE